MLTLTTVPFKSHTLLLASGLVDGGQAKMVMVNWLDDDSHWSECKSFNAVQKRYQKDSKSNDDKHHIIFVDYSKLNPVNKTEEVLLNTIKQLNLYQQGKLTQFDLPLDTTLGTPFQQSVWQALQQIPYGQTISYAALAANINKPTAFRAVANANGKNPFSIVIPCHRVIASDGSLGGYTGGIDKKTDLLQHEQNYKAH